MSECRTFARKRPFYFENKILDVAAAIQNPADCLQYCPVGRLIVPPELVVKIAINLRQQREKTFALLFEPGPRGFIALAQLLQHHVQLEYFFEQLRRNIFRPLLADIETFQLQQVLGTLHRVAKYAPGIVYLCGGVECIALFLRWATGVSVRMKLPAQLIEFALQCAFIDVQPARDTEQLKVIGRQGVRHVENDVPQPQLLVACGLSNANPE